jgi:hypothetical protein
MEGVSPAAANDPWPATAAAAARRREKETLADTM